MRKIITSLLLSSSCSLCLAQLNVYSNGNVSVKNTDNALSAFCIDTIGRTGYQMAILSKDRQGVTIERKGAPNNIDGSWAYGLVTRSSNGNYYSVGGKFVAERLGMDQTAYGRSFGVIGNAGYSSSGYNYGVFGNLLGNSYGAAVYGSTTSHEAGTYVDGRYAGYFRGDVKVTGSVRVLGTLNGMTLNTAPAPSNCTLFNEENEEGALTAISRLSATTYFKDAHTKGTGDTPEQADSTSTEMDIVTKLQAQDLSKEHYGLDIKSLEETLPNLVYENEDGTKSINYIEIIPLLVQSINELKARLEESDKQKVKHADASSIVSEPTDLLSLSQNDPNPFSSSTSISMNIPTSTSNACLVIYDMTGKQLRQIEITGRGKTSVTLTSEGLTPGMYLYALIADGQVINTKRMILN